MESVTKYPIQNLRYALPNEPGGVGIAEGRRPRQARHGERVETAAKNRQPGLGLADPTLLGHGAPELSARVDQESRARIRLGDVTEEQDQPAFGE